MFGFELAIPAAFTILPHHFIHAFIKINDFLDGALVEFAIVATSVLFFLWAGRFRPLKIRCSRPTSKLDTMGSVSHCTFDKSKSYQDATPNSASDLASPDKAHQVQLLVASLLSRTGRSIAPEALQNYYNLVHRQGVALNQHIRDGQQARTFYIALIGCSLKAPIHIPEIEMHTNSWTVWLLQDMRYFGFARSLPFYAAVVKMHTQQHCFQELIALHDEMYVDRIVPDLAVEIHFMNAAVACDDSEKATFFFEGICRRGPPAIRSYMTMLRVYTRRKDWKGAVELMESMPARGNSPDNLVLNHVLSLCVSAGQVREAEDLVYKWNELVDVVSCNIVLKGYSQQAEFPKAESMLEHMMKNGPSPNLITFNTVMDCVVRVIQNWSSLGRRSGDKDGRCGSYTQHSIRTLARRPWAYLDRMIEQGLAPDRYTLSTLVKGMHLTGGSSEELVRAVQLLRHLSPSGLRGVAKNSSSRETNSRLVEVLFNTLLDICCSRGDLDTMTEIFGMMQQFHVDVSAVTYGTLIKAFGQSGRVQCCHEVWKQMLGTKLEASVVTYGCYIDACLRNEDVKTAEELFHTMIQRGVQPNAVIYTSLIRGLAAAAQPVKAFALYRRMRQEGVEPTSVTFNSVLDMVARQLSDPGTLQEVLSDMSQAHAVPDAITYSILIKASCNAGNVDNAIALFKRIRDMGIAFDQVAFNMLLLACSRADRYADAEEVFQEMCRLGMMPNSVTTSILVKMYGRAKMPDKAVATFDFVEREYKLKQNLFAYTCVIQACVQNRQVRRSWEIFDRMLCAGVEPDAVTYGTVIHGCVYLNRFDQAMSLVRHAYMQPARQPLSDTWDSSDRAFAVEALSLKKPVELQPEVLHTLLAAMQRKDETLLVLELKRLIAAQSHTH